MSADTYLYVLDDKAYERYCAWRDAEFIDEWDSCWDFVHEVTNTADRVWIGQGSGSVVDDYTPAPVAFVTRLFTSAPVLTEGLAKAALSCMNMRNDSFYGSTVEHFHGGEVLEINWPGLSNRGKYDPDRSRHNSFHPTRVVHGKGSSPRILTFRSRGVAAGRPVKQFFERNMGKRIIPMVE